MESEVIILSLISNILKEIVGRIGVLTKQFESKKINQEKSHLCFMD